MRRRNDLLALAALAGLAAFLVAPTLGSGEYPPGIDIFGHLFKPWYLTRHFREYGNIPQWMPLWYNGLHVIQYYPPLSYIVLTGLELITGDIFRAYQLFIFLSFLASGWLTYLLARRWLGPLPATFAALSFTAAPYSLMAVFWEGNMPRTLAMPLLPLVPYLAVRLLEKGRRWDFLSLCVVIALLVLAHHMPAAIALICLVPFITIYAWSRHLPVGRVLIVLLASGIGLFLSAWWLLPGITNKDLADVPNLSALPERIAQYSTGIDLLNPRTRLDRNAYLGLVPLLFSGLALLLFRRAWLRGPALAAFGTAVFFSLGKNNPIFPYIPLLSRWFPERFLQVGVLYLALLVGLFFERLWRSRASSARKLALVGVAGLVLAVDLWPDYSLTRVSSEERLKRLSVTELSQWLAGEANPGRLLVQAPVNWDTAFTPYSIGGKEQNYGWAPEGSPHSVTAGEINWMLRNERYGYAERVMALWDTRYLVLDPSIPEQEELASFLMAHGWERIDLPIPWTILALKRPSARLMRMDRDILVIGRGAPVVAGLFPWVAEGKSPYIDDYDEDFLSLFKGILLYNYNYHDRQKAEELLTRLAESGVRVWVDTSLREGEYFFGVEFFPTEFTGNKVLTEKEGAGLLPERTVEMGPFFHEEGKLIMSWKTYLPNGLDEALVTTPFGQWQAPVFGYKDLGPAKIYFLALGLMGHAFEKADPKTMELLTTILGDLQPNREVWPAPFPVLEKEWRDQSLRFQYEAEDKSPIIISMTYTPHWRAELDGAPLQIYNYEDLCLVILPPGRHSVSFSYGLSQTQAAANLVSAVALLGLAISIACLPWMERRLQAAANYLRVQLLR